jgi:hypothetical protein
MKKESRKVVETSEERDLVKPPCHKRVSNSG